MNRMSGFYFLDQFIFPVYNAGNHLIFDVDHLENKPEDMI